MKHAILYRGTWLMRGSLAHQLHTAGELKKLDGHLKQLDAEDRKRTGEQQLA